MSKVSKMSKVSTVPKVSNVSNVFKVSKVSKRSNCPNRPKCPKCLHCQWVSESVGLWVNLLSIEVLTHLKKSQALPYEYFIVFPLLEAFSKTQKLLKLVLMCTTCNHLCPKCPRWPKCLKCPKCPQCPERTNVWMDFHGISCWAKCQFVCLSVRDFVES